MTKNNSALLMLIFAASVAMAQPPSQPNIVLFLVDDMGWTDTSVPFDKQAVDNNHKYYTPHMQRLANMGMKFTNAYANSVCTPSRVSLVTGMTAARHRVTNWTNSDLDNPTDAPYEGLKWPQWNYNGLSAVAGYNNTVVATTLPALLTKAGYYTSIVGKGHFAAYGVPAAYPQNLGFIESIASDAIGNPRNYLGRENFGNKERFGYTYMGGVRGLEQYHGQDIFLSEALTLEAKKTIDRATGLEKPFFLYMSHYAVHTPITADERFYQKYLDRGLDSVEARYASLVEGMDKSLGDLIDYVKEKGIDHNTIFLFMSDNGGLALNPPRGGAELKQNYPLRSGKGSLYEGGVREPMLVYWPGVTRPGTVSHQYLNIEDFFPTLLEMAGVQRYQTVQKIDGKSFLPYLKDPSKKDNERVLTWHFPSNWGQGASTVKKNYKGRTVEDLGMGPASAVRKGEWKLIYFYGTGKYELYNLANDLKEQKDLAKSNPGKAKEMISLLNRELEIQQAQFPADIKTGKEIKPSFR